MDPNKKFLHFNPDEADSEVEGSQQNAVTVPVSTFAGMETTTVSNLRMFFKESVETDTLDLTLSRTLNSNPRDLMEHIVNEINFSNNAVITIADDFTGETIHPDVNQMTSVEFADHSSVKFQKIVVSSITSANPAGAGAPPTTSNVGEFNSEIITTLFVDLADGSNTVACPDIDLRAIGINASDSPAYITRITTDVNGIVYRGEMICVETPSGANTTGQIDLVVSPLGTTDPGEGALAGPGSDVIMNMNNGFQIGEVRNFDSSTINTGAGSNPQGNITSTGIVDQYLYLVVGVDSEGGGDYADGKFLIRLFGAKTTGL